MGSRDGELRHLCPSGEIATSVSTPFDPQELRLSSDGKLFHSMQTKLRRTRGEGPRRELFGPFSDTMPRILGLLESNTAQPLLEHLEVSEEASSGFALQWDDGLVVPIKSVEGELPLA